MIVKLIGKRERKAAVELSINDLLVLTGSAKRFLANPDVATAEHTVAAEAFTLLEAELLGELRDEGFADPVFIAECLNSQVQDVLDALAILNNKRKELRASPTAYYSPKVLSFNENYQPPLTWPSDNPSSDAP